MNHQSNLYREFFNSVDDPVFISDVTTRTIVESNTCAAAFSGYRVGELQGLAVDRLLQFPGKLEFLFEGQKASWHGLELCKKDGEHIPVSLTTFRVDYGTTGYVFLVVHKVDAMVSSCHESKEPGDVRWQAEINFPTIIGRSKKIHDVCQLIGSIAKRNVTVLIQGESGTGKEVVANAIQAHSLRARDPFVKVNCAALSETLLESELFGHVRGAFTGAIRDRRGRFQQADRGTIFLDEIGSLSLAAQAKLLRVLQEQEFEPVGSSVTTAVDVRVLAATNTDLRKAVSEGKFREDLYYRLNVLTIALPPLRERKEDIPFLAAHFLKRSSQRIGKEQCALAPETLTLLLRHDWPGNARELQNAIEHAVLVEKGALILPSSLPTNLGCSEETENFSAPSGEESLRMRLALCEKEIILEALTRANGVKRQAASILGLDPRNLPYFLRKHHLHENCTSH